MKNKTIVIVPGEPNSIFYEILFKSIKSIKIDNPIILIGSKKIMDYHLKKLKFRLKTNLLSDFEFDINQLDKKK